MEIVVQRCLRAIALILSWLPGALGAAAPALAPAHDLAADARQMRARGSVMLVLYSRAGCHWCERARNEVLLPLLRDPASSGRILLREIALDEDTPLADFSGRRTTHRRFAAGEGVRFTPTLMVFGPDGRHLAKPLVGFLTPDFYAEYVSRLVEQGLERLQSPSRAD